MTGWRMGWAVAPPAVAKAMGDIQSQETSCPSSVSQYAAIAALEGAQECVAQMLQEFAARRRLVCSRLRAMPGVRVNEPDGAFYAFFDVSHYFGSRSAAGRSEIRWLLHGVPGVGPRQPGARLGVRRRGLRADVVRHEPGTDRRRTRPAGGVARRAAVTGRPILLLLTEDDVRRLLTMEVALEAVEAGCGSWPSTRPKTFRGAVAGPITSCCT